MILIDGGGTLAASIQAVHKRFDSGGCHVMSLTDHAHPEELTPITLAVQVSGSRTKWRSRGASTPIARA